MCTCLLSIQSAWKWVYGCPMMAREGRFPCCPPIERWRKHLRFSRHRFHWLTGIVRICCLISFLASCIYIYLLTLVLTHIVDIIIKKKKIMWKLTWTVVTFAPGSSPAFSERARAAESLQNSALPPIAEYSLSNLLWRMFCSAFKKTIKKIIKTYFHNLINFDYFTFKTVGKICGLPLSSR